MRFLVFDFGEYAPKSKHKPHKPRETNTRNRPKSHARNPLEVCAAQTAPGRRLCAFDSVLLHADTANTANPTR
eukprot:38181-Rhodomonas_salina.3